MTAEEFFRENLRGKPLTEESVIESLKQYAKFYAGKYLNTDAVTRLEIINHSSKTEDCNIGRVFTHYEVKSCELSFQDSMRTLKIFI